MGHNHLQGRADMSPYSSTAITRIRYPTQMGKAPSSVQERGEGTSDCSSSCVTGSRFHSRESLSLLGDGPQHLQYSCLASSAASTLPWRRSILTRDFKSSRYFLSWTFCIKRLWRMSRSGSPIPKSLLHRQFHDGPSTEVWKIDKLS